MNIQETKTSVLLDRASLLAKEVLEIVKVDLGKGSHVFVRQMTGRERDTFEQSMVQARRDVKGNIIAYDQALADFRAKLAVVTLCDEAGELLLKPSDYTVLSANMSAARLAAIADAAQKVNRMSEEDKEGLVKNLESGQGDASSSDCAGN